MRVAVAVALLLGLSRSAAAEPRVAFVNLAEDAAAGQIAIERLRGPAANRSGHEALELGAVRTALEAPLGIDDPTADPLAGATDLLTRAADSLSNFELDEAVDAIGEAEALVVSIEPDPSVVDLLHRANVLLGRVYFLDNDKAGALIAFRTANAIAPEHTSLDPGLYRRALVRLYAQAVSDNATGPKGKVVVRSEPAGATIWVDGRDVGAGPVELELPVGVHYVVADLDGHDPAGVRVPVVDGQVYEGMLTPMAVTVEQRIERLRRRGKEADVAALARVANVELLIAVRTTTGGGVETAVYDVARSSMSEWIDATDDEVVLSLLPASAVRVPHPSELDVGAGEDGRTVAGLGEPKRDGRGGSSWKTWLVVGGVAAAVTTAIVIAMSGGDTTYELGGFCFADGCRDD